MTKAKKFKLCYIDDENTAWFTTASLSKQWGDDWDDKPYEHNAEEPNIMEGEEYKTLKFSGCFRMPCDAHLNSPFSVQDINNKVIPWIATWNQKNFCYAGTTFEKFIKFIQKHDGTVYLPLK